jgi:hypothetical protein
VNVPLLVKVCVMRNDCEAPPPVDVWSSTLVRSTFAVPVTAAVVVSVKSRSRYCAAALMAAVPLVVKPLMVVQVVPLFAVPMA